jgi:hypothetical protein
MTATSEEKTRCMLNDEIVSILGRKSVMLRLLWRMQHACVHSHRDRNSAKMSEDASNVERETHAQSLTGNRRYILLGVWFQHRARRQDSSGK